MPYRVTPIIPGEIYHIYNRSVAKQPIFVYERDYKRALGVINFYSYQRPVVRFSHYSRLPTEVKENFLVNLRKNHQKQIKLLAFCLMPNHIHFLIQEVVDGGITNFVRNFQNSCAKYFNLKTERNGALFQAGFKAVRIESDEQLIHVCRYIHLNPLSSFVVKSAEDLIHYPWTSFKFYLQSKELVHFRSKETPFHLEKDESGIVDTEVILNYFSSVDNFKSFTFDQVDYQRRLEEIKHLALE